ncbi:MAG TPA: radical SAM protein [Myxococcota bacterium]|nr:radical SAM protein [Myxococcota bacterium]
MDLSGESRLIRIAAGCSLGCSFCTVGQGREGVCPDDAVAGRFEIPEASRYLLLAGNLLDRRFAPTVSRLAEAGADKIDAYVHCGPADPAALKDLAAAGLTGIQLVLPSAEREMLAGLTGGRGSLKMAAMILSGARELGLEVTLQIPVMKANAESIDDTVARASRLCMPARVTLDFVSESRRDGTPNKWDPAIAIESVTRTIKFCQDNGVIFQIGRNEAPPPCIFPLKNVPALAWGDLAGIPSDGNIARSKAPFEACAACDAREICTFSGRHLEPSTPPRPLRGGQGGDQDQVWLDAAAIWVRRNELRTLRQELARRHPICMNPWTNLETHSVRGVAISCATHRFQYGTVDQCVSWHDVSLAQAWNSDVMQSLRHQMKIGQPHLHCRPDCVVFHGGGPGDSWLTADPLTDVFHRNLVTNLKEIIDGAEILESMPQNLVIAPSLHCNIACIMCRFPGEVRDAPDPSKTMMSERQFDEVIEMMPYLRVLNITGGEPLIADGTRRLLKAFKTDRFRDGGIALTTNGILLDKSLISDMKKSRLLSIIISVNAASRETYRHVTLVDAYDRVINNVTELMRARREFNPLPRVVLSFVIMKCNFREIPDHIRTAARLGTDIQLLPMVGKLGGESMFMCRQDLQELLDFVDREVVPLVAGMKGNFRREVTTLRSTMSRRIKDDDYSMF